jgi:putative hydrolase of the HAD superfamily
LTRNIMMLYKYLFFDLDNTLLNFRANALETFSEIFNMPDLGIHPFQPDTFLAVFEKHNNWFWTEYSRGRTKKSGLREERFIRTFNDLGVEDPELAIQVSDLYMKLAPLKSNLFDQVPETLQYLSAKYSLYLLTNGFTDNQVKKLEASNLRGYFKKLFIAEMVGYPKPDRRIFEYAVKSIHAHKKECIMIGDDVVADIEGAKNAGIDQVFFNPNGKPIHFTPTLEITSISELRNLF